MTQFQENGFGIMKTKEEGFFKDGVRDGKWYMYNETGDSVKQLVFISGIIDSARTKEFKLPVKKELL